MKIYFDNDCNKNLIQNKKIGFIGYGAQGRAHALNLKDSGVIEIKIALYEGSKTTKQVLSDGLILEELINLVQWADIIIFAIPDEKHAEIYKKIENYLRTDIYLCFFHGLSIHFDLIKPKKDINIFMVASKGPGYAVREEFLQSRGTLCLVAIAQDITSHTKELALSYACALGSGKAGIIETNFKDECIADLFGEQAVLCGGLTELIYSGYDVLVKNGIDPHIAYLECVHEVKLVVDLIYKKGIAEMNKSISNTAEWGEYIAGSKIINNDVKNNMQLIFDDILNGNFTKKWMQEYHSGLKNMQQIRIKKAAKPIEKIGMKIRSLLPWLSQ